MPVRGGLGNLLLNMELSDDHDLSYYYYKALFLGSDLFRGSLVPAFYEGN